MDWIFDNFQFVILIALAIGSVVKQMAEAAKMKKEQREQPPETQWEETETTWTPIPIPPEFQPPPRSAPPPLQRSVPPPLLKHFETFQAPPPLPAEETENLLRKQLEMQEKVRALRENKAAEKARMLEKQARSATRVKTQHPAQLGVRSLLANPTTARKAIVLREILDKPLGMR